MDDSRTKRLQMAMMTKRAKDTKINLADMLGVKQPMKLPTRPTYTPPKKEKEVDPEVKAEGEKLKKQIERDAAECEKRSKDKMKKKSYLQFKQAFKVGGTGQSPAQPKPMTPQVKPQQPAAPASTNNQQQPQQQTQAAKPEQPQAPTTTTTTTQKPDGTTITKEEKPVTQQPASTPNTTGQTQPQEPAAPKLPALDFSDPTKVREQITGFLLNHPGFAPAVEANKPQEEKQEPQSVGEKIVGAVSDFIRSGAEKVAPNMVAGYDYNKMDAQGRANVISTMLQDPNTEKAVTDALAKGDMAALDMFFGSQNQDPNAPKDTNAEALKIVWDKMPEDQKQRFIDAGKACAWNGIKSNFFTGIPKAIALWFKMQGWNEMGEFAQNPMNFYLTLGGLLVGGTALAGVAFGGGGNEQPVINVSNGQSNPFYTHEF